MAKLTLYSGVLSLGVGDSIAALFGKLFGKTRWPGECNCNIPVTYMYMFNPCIYMYIYTVHVHVHVHVHVYVTKLIYMYIIQ